MRKVCWVVALAPFVTGAGAEACQTPVDVPALVADLETGCGLGNADRVSAAIVLAQSSDASESAGNAVTGAAPEMTAQNQPGVSEAEATETATEETAPADSAPEGQAEKPASEQEATSSEEDPVSDEAAVELVFWQSVKDSEDPSEFEEYLKQFPNGRFAGLAKIKIKRLKKAAAAKAEPQPAETEQGEPERAEPVREEAAKEDTVKEDTAKEEAVKEEAVKKETVKEETAEDEGGEEDSGQAVTDQADVPPAPDQQTSSDEDTEPSATTPAQTEDTDDAVAAPQQASAPVQLCDRIAGHPEDELRKAKGVHLELMAAERGRNACRKAIKAYPDEPRFIYQMGRSHAASGNYGEAKDWIKRAADLGYPMAVTHMGELYFEGNGYPKNPRLAARWFLKATKLGNARAHLLFGDMLELGEGVQRNPARAAHYVFQAVKKRNRSSIYQMNRNSSEWSAEFRREFQILMRDAGVYNGDIDGAFGPQTRRAVIRLAQGRGQQ